MLLRKDLFLAIAIVVSGCASRGVVIEARPDDLPSVNGHECTGPGWTTVSPDPITVEDSSGVICRKGGYHVIVNASSSGQGVASYVTCPAGFASDSQEWKNGLVRAGILSCYKDGPDETLLVCQINSVTIQTSACPVDELKTWEPIKRGMSPAARSKCAPQQCACRDYTALEVLRHVKVDARPECCSDYSGPSSGCGE